MSLRAEQFVPKDYRMNPATEDLLPDGVQLEEGMVVLVEDHTLRANTDELKDNQDVWAVALMRNRWAKVTELSLRAPYSVEFIALYADGSKRKITLATSYAWLVKHERADEWWGTIHQG